MSDTRTLLLMRHASAEIGPGLRDFDRALTGHGRGQAETVGRLLAELGYAPDHVICSAARRTRQTLDGVLEAMDLATPPEVDYSEAVYSAGPDALLESVNYVDPDADTVLVVAHNPTVAQVAASFVGPAALAAYEPATVAAIELEVEWLYAAPGTGSGRLLN